MKGLRENSSSAPGVTRTPGQRFRKPLLYPTELRGQTLWCDKFLDGDASFEHIAALAPAQRPFANYGIHIAPLCQIFSEG